MNNRGKLLLDHVAIEVNNLEDAIHFYTKIMGLPLLDTPDSVKDKGVQWIKLNDRQAIHLVENGQSRPGEISHLALQVDDVEEWQSHFKRNRVKIDPPKFNMYKARRFFVLDPSGNRIEFLKWL